MWKPQKAVVQWLVIKYPRMEVTTRGWAKLWDPLELPELYVAKRRVVLIIQCYVKRCLVN
jgi:hypothetical protein